MKMNKTILLVFGILLSCVSPQSPDDILISAVSSSSKKVSSEYNLCPFGFGIAGPVVHGFSLEYDFNGELSIDEARNLVVPVFEDLKKEIRSRFSALQIPQERLSDDEIVVSIGFRDSSNKYVISSTHIAIVRVSHGKVIYSRDKGEVTGFYKVYTEPYSEAYEKVFGNKDSSTSN